MLDQRPELLVPWRVLSAPAVCFALCHFERSEESGLPDEAGHAQAHRHRSG